jgi:hypothetical protein
MTLTITLSPTVERQLRAEAEATGKQIDTLVVEAVEARLSLARLRLKDILAPVHEDFMKSGMTETELEQLLETALSSARAKRASASETSA